MTPLVKIAPEQKNWTGPKALAFGYFGFIYLWMFLENFTTFPFGLSKTDHLENQCEIVRSEKAKCTHCMWNHERVWARRAH